MGLVSKTISSGSMMLPPSWPLWVAPKGQQSLKFSGTERLLSTLSNSSRSPRESKRLPPSVGRFPGSSYGKESACNTGDPGSVPGSGRSPGEGNGYLFQYSCLENPLDRGAWWATDHGVAKSWTRLSDFTFTFTFIVSLSDFLISVDVTFSNRPEVHFISSQPVQV